VVKVPEGVVPAPRTVPARKVAATGRPPLIEADKVEAVLELGGLVSTKLKEHARVDVGMLAVEVSVMVKFWTPPTVDTDSVAVLPKLVASVPDKAREEVGAVVVDWIPVIVMVDPDGMSAAVVVPVATGCRVTVIALLPPLILDDSLTVDADELKT